MSEGKYYGSGIVWPCKHSPSGQCNSKACDPWGRGCVLAKPVHLPVDPKQEDR